MLATARIGEAQPDHKISSISKVPPSRTTGGRLFADQRAETAVRSRHRRQHVAALRLPTGMPLGHGAINAAFRMERTQIAIPQLRTR
jgi:hypothetical protein